MLYCPFTGCPNMLVAQSSDSLTKHLSRVHLAAGQSIPSELLVSLKQSACNPCGQLPHSRDMHGVWGLGGGYEGRANPNGCGRSFLLHDRGTPWEYGTSSGGSGPNTSL